MVEHKLLNAHPATLLEELPGSCEPADLCHTPGSFVLYNLQGPEEVPITCTPKRDEIAEDRDKDSIGSHEPGLEWSISCKFLESI